MSEIIARKGAKGKTLYYIRFIDTDGKRKMKAAPPGTVPRSEKAREKAAEEHGAAITTRIRQGKVGVIAPTAEEKARATITLAELVERFGKEYRPHKLKDANAYHVQARSIFAARILPFRLDGKGETFGQRAAASITRREIDQFSKALAADGYAANSIRHTLRTLSRLYTWGAHEAVIDCPNPVKGAERPAAVATVDYLDAGEVRRLLHAAQDARGSAIGTAAVEAGALLATLAVALYAGLRKGELFGLRWRDLDLAAGRLTVARSYRLAPKSNKVRHLPINPELLPILRRWREECPTTAENLVLPTLSPNGKVWRMGEHDEDLGLPSLLKVAKCHAPEDGRAWHLLRHTFASQFMMAGGNILSLQKLLGHSDLKMTLIYAHLAPDFMQTEIARMSFATAPAADVVALDAHRGRAVADGYGVDTNSRRDG